jgi:16S rRNA (cytosine1402-N4)-methyltransferase
MNVAPRLHVSVLSDEVLHWLNPRPGQTFVDGTLGAGGHARALAQRVGSSGLVFALDRDAAALSAAEKNLAGLPIAIAQSNFCDLAEVLAEVGLTTVDGILLDLGLSSDQLADPERGFSFDSPGPLDLRFDTEMGEPAWRLLERLDAEDLADILFRFGQERFSRRIARRIVEQRTVEPIATAAQLAQLVRRAIPATADTRRIDAATRTFQALRIAVNGELDSLDAALRRLPNLLSVGGRLAIISFHSLEDRLVKEAFRSDPRLTPLTKKPVRPGEAEMAQNPRSRSAKMRVACRVGP